MLPRALQVGLRRITLCLSPRYSLVRSNKAPATVFNQPAQGRKLCLRLRRSHSLPLRLSTLHGVEGEAFSIVVLVFGTGQASNRVPSSFSEGELQRAVFSRAAVSRAEAREHARGTLKPHWHPPTACCQSSHNARFSDTVAVFGGHRRWFAGFLFSSVRSLLLLEGQVFRLVLRVTALSLSKISGPVFRRITSGQLLWGQLSSGLR